MKPKPINSFPRFTKSKLGTKWIHIPTQTVYELRRTTDSKTLIGNLYLYNRENDYVVEEIITKDWKLL